jgi:CBS domain-containing protein
VLIMFGLYMAFAPSFRAYFMGLWSALVGFFLLGAASSVVKSASSAEPMTAGEAMAPAIEISPDLSIARFVDEVLPVHRYETFPVAERGQLLGILALADLKQLPRDRWRDRRVRDAMRATSPLLFISQSSAMTKATELMQRNEIGALGVVDGGGRLIGFLRRKVPKSV